MRLAEKSSNSGWLSPAVSHEKLIWLLAFLLIASGGQAEEPEKAELSLKRFGVTVQVPQDWTPIRTEKNDQAFVLELPGENGEAGGFAACELGIAPERLEEYQTRIQASDDREQQEESPKRKLLENDLIPTADQPQEKQLVSVWRYVAPQGEANWLEVRTRLIRHDTLYTFILSAEEQRFKKLRPAFEAVLASARFTQPETGLQRMPGGYWMQRDFRFAMKLPTDWSPGIAPNDKALFFATGTKHQVFTDNLIVLARPRAEMDLGKLQKALPEQIAQVDKTAQVPHCQIVDQGEGKALETIIHIQRGPFKITVFDRRFEGRKRNYEVRFTCITDEFAKLEEALRKSLDSFQEFEGAAPEKLTF